MLTAKWFDAILVLNMNVSDTSVKYTYLRAHIKLFYENLIHRELGGKRLQFLASLLFPSQCWGQISEVVLSTIQMLPQLY